MRILACGLIVLLTGPAHAGEPAPIIDMHLHASAADDPGPPPVGVCTPFDPFPAWDPSQPYGAAWMATLKQPPCDDPVWSPETDEALMAQTLEVLEQRNVFGVLSGSADRVATWMAAAPGRFFPGLEFRLGRDSLTPESLRALHAEGRLAVLAEVSNQYAGIAPDDERMEPYWALAEELDLPVGIHIGTGPPGVIYLGAAGYRGRLHSALTLEEPLVRHPGLWPGVIERAIAVIEEAPFLSEDQKRGIFYDNAARFLRLSQEEIARHHGR